MVRKGFSSNTILIVMGILVILAGGAYFINQQSITQNNPPAIIPSPQPTTTPQPTPTPASTPQPTSPPANTNTVNLNQSFTMKAGDQVEVSGTGLKIKITVIASAESGTYDKPNRVEGQAIYQGQIDSLSFTLGGNQTQEMANLRRQKDVFSLFNIYVQQVTSSEVTLIVKKI